MTMATICATTQFESVRVWAGDGAIHFRPHYFRDILFVHLLFLNWVWLKPT